MKKILAASLISLALLANACSKPAAESNDTPGGSGVSVSPIHSPGIPDGVANATPVVMK